MIDKKVHITNCFGTTYLVEVKEVTSNYIAGTYLLPRTGFSSGDIWGNFPFKEIVKLEVVR